jgi:cyanophycinase
VKAPKAKPTSSFLSVLVVVGVVSVAFVGLGPIEAAAGTPGAPPEAAELEPPAHESPFIGRRLLISGGTLTDTLVGLYVDRLAADVGGKERLRLLVVPGASAAPSWLYRYFRRVLPSRGVSDENIELAHIAALDDPESAADEAGWRHGAYEPSEIAKVAWANVVWFSGGDQRRLVTLLVDGAGVHSPFETALRHKFDAGRLIIAGHSAGAAAMSHPMIARGTSLGSLSLAPDPSCRSAEALCVQRGLGYVPSDYQVVVDQHFTQRGRLARLVRALALSDRKTGWGVGARAALHVDLMQHRAEVLGVPGKAFVTIVGRDGAAENHEQDGPPFVGSRYTVSVLSAGDRYRLPDSAHPHGVGSHPVAEEVYSPFSRERGVRVLSDAFGRNVLTDRIAAYFADGTPQASGVAHVDALAFDTDESGAAKGFRLRFTADEDSAVAWSPASGFSLFDARLEISTLSAQFVGLGS